MPQRVKAERIELIEFAGNFRFARKKLGLTQTDISNKANLSQEFISSFERASMGIGIDSMSALSHSLEIPLYCLLEPGFQSLFDFDLKTSAWIKYLRLLPVCEQGTSERLIFGKNFKTARIAINYTQAQIFERTGIPDTQITLIERGLAGSEFQTALKLARSVGKNLFILFKP